MAEMKRLFWRLYWAGGRFVAPGLYLWAFGDNRRILPVSMWLLAFFHLDDQAVCGLSEGCGLHDYHDYKDDVSGAPAHLVTLRCKRCRKEFVI